MKRVLLSFFLLALVCPVISQNPPSAKEKKHTTKSARLRTLIETDTPKHKFADIFEAGAIAVKNNLQADSMMVSMYDQKDLSWQPYRKEYPMYFNSSTLIKELENWGFDGNDYYPSYRYVAAYSADNRLSRLETHIYSDGKWVPVYAEESALDAWEEETYYAYYYYNEGTGDWEMIFGYRAVDEHNDNDALVQRTWEYFENNQWTPDYREEYILNEQDVIIEIIEYGYEQWSDTWEKEFRMVLELCDNNMWQQGYAYFWDWMDETWVPELKYTGFEWFDFDKMLLSHLTVMVNSDEFDDWDDWKGYDDIDWINYMRISINYNDEGKMTMMMQEMWNDFDWKEDWMPLIKMETEYDHLSNIVYESFSLHDGDEWMVLFGYMLDMEYNNDDSIKSFIYYTLGFEWDDWKDAVMPWLMYTFYYSDDTTDTPIVDLPDTGLKVFPNPASHYLQIELSGTTNPVNITIVGVDGRVAARYNQVNAIPGQALTVDVSGLKSGVYLLMVNDTAMNRTTRFVKR